MLQSQDEFGGQSPPSAESRPLRRFIVQIVDLYAIKCMITAIVYMYAAFYEVFRDSSCLLVHGWTEIPDFQSADVVDWETKE